jgi:hypothetical protein
MFSSLRRQIVTAAFLLTRAEVNNQAKAERARQRAREDVVVISGLSAILLRALQEADQELGQACRLLAANVPLESEI